VNAKRLKLILLVAGVTVYAVWAYAWPVDALRRRYGESGLTWGLLVFGVMIPYLVYFVAGFFRKDTPEE